MQDVPFVVLGGIIEGILGREDSQAGKRQRMPECTGINQATNARAVKLSCGTREPLHRGFSSQPLTRKTILAMPEEPPGLWMIETLIPLVLATVTCSNVNT